MKTIKAFLDDHSNGYAPKTAIILGSGLGALVDDLVDPIRIAYKDLEGFPAGNVSGHGREIICGKLYNQTVLMLSGRVHYYEQGDAAAMRPVIAALKAFGIENLIVTNAAGSLKSDMPPGSVMMIEDHISWSGMNPLIGEDTDARFVDLSQAYCPTLRAGFQKAAQDINIELCSGVYMWFSGPSFETPAEIKMAAMLGADAVGMSTVPEAILARFYGMKVAGFSVITNFGAGMDKQVLSHNETKEMAPIGGEKLTKILKHAAKIGHLP